MVHVGAPVIAYARGSASTWAQDSPTTSGRSSFVDGSRSRRLGDARCQCTTSLLQSLGCTNFGSAVVVAHVDGPEQLGTIREAFLCSTAPSLHELAFAEARSADARFGLAETNNFNKSEIIAIDAIDASVRLPTEVAQELNTIPIPVSPSQSQVYPRVSVWKLDQVPRPASRIVLQIVLNPDGSDASSPLRHHVPPSMQAQVHAFLMGVAVLQGAILHRPAGKVCATKYCELNAYTPLCRPLIICQLLSLH
jgi:hypothetical protein